LLLRSPALNGYRERREQMLKNAERTRRLAEKAQAELEKRKQHNG
jgi:hypothetical protein